MARLQVKPVTHQTSKGDAVSVLKWTGVVNSDTLSQFRRLAEAHLKRNPTRVVFDLARVTYMNSSGLGELVRFQDLVQEKGGSLIIARMPPELERLVELLGLHKVLAVCPLGRVALRLFELGKTDLDSVQSVHRRIRRLRASRQGLSAAPAKRSRPAPKPFGNSVLMVAPKRDFFSSYVKNRLSGEQARFDLVHSSSEARTVLDKETPDLLILDDSVDGARDLCRQVKGDAKRRLPVLSVHATGKGPDQFPGLVLLADEHLVEPFALNELVALARTEYLKSRRQQEHVKQRVLLQVPSTERDTAEALSVLSRWIGDSGLTPDKVTGFQNAVREAVDNARRHGNKSQPGRTIRTEFVLTTDRVAVTIGDKGKGFDYASYLGRARKADPAEIARATQKQGGTGGLGIVLMVRGASHVDYRAPGNTVTLVQSLKAGPKSD